MKTTTPGFYAFCTFRFGKGPAKVAQIDASALAFLDTTENLVDNREKLFARRKLAGPLQQDTPTRDLLAPHMVKNFDMLKANAKEGKKVGATGHCVGDLSQNPAKRHRAGPFLPTQQKSSLTATILPESLDHHVYTCNELSFAHGWPTVEFVPPEYKECLNYDLSDYGLSHQQRLIGDGMSLNCVQAFALYVFSHSVRKDTLDRYIPRPLTCKVFPCEDQEDDPPVSLPASETRTPGQAETPTPGEAVSPAGEPFPDTEVEFNFEGMDEIQPQEISRLPAFANLAPGRLNVLDTLSMDDEVITGALMPAEVSLPVAGEDLPDFPQEEDGQLMDFL